MKKIGLIILFSFLPFIRLSAQVSEVEKIYVSNSNNYIHYTSVVRNYNDTINILMSYGHAENESATDSAVGHCTFYTQNTNTGEIKRLFDMRRGYKVNDIRFVTLRKRDGSSTVDFCCFCGTRSKFERYEFPLDPTGSGTLLPIEIHSKHGFAGFFSMNEALNPLATFTAKVRDVEKTKELYRMTCYAESNGWYYENPYNAPFLDNAVLDIIGLEDTVNAPSCFCRVKFYPDYPVYGVYWDNNIRYNNTEVLTDITRTEDYVVTVSHNTNGDSLWTRHSDKENYFYMGGVELNDYVNAIDCGMAHIDLSCDESDEIHDFVRLNNEKICCTRNNEIAVVFRMAAMGYGGLVACRYDYINGFMHFIQGAYLHCIPELKEVLHMPLNDATSFLYDQNDDYLTVLIWEKNKKCCYPAKHFFHGGTNTHSVTLQYRNSYEHLLWSGGKLGIYPLLLMTQRGNMGGGFNNTCHKENLLGALPIELDHLTVYKQMRIKIRYPYDPETYPITYVPFTPTVIESKKSCVK